MFPDLTGMEREFEPIKQYIWSGGDNRFVRQRMNQFVANFRRGERPIYWMHLLAVVRTYEQITAYAQFFAGPRSLQENVGRRDPGGCGDPGADIVPPSRHPATELDWSRVGKKSVTATIRCSRSE